MLVREKKHRLAGAAYRGRVVGAFTVCTLQRSEPLSSSAIFAIAQQALLEAFQKQQGHCGVYVFMPDHLHLIVSGSGPGSDLLRMITEFKQKTAFRTHQAGLSFAWQKGFYDHLIRAAEEYGAQVRYVLRNPVRRGLCSRWQDWPWKGTLGQTWEELAVSIISL